MDFELDVELPLRERTMGKLLSLRAQTSGNKTCLIFEDQRFTYAQVDRITNRIANGLARLGIGKGQHVAMLLENTPETVWTFLALGKIGAVAVSINTAAKGELLATYFTQSESTTLITEAAFVERFEGIRDRCPLVTNLVIVDRPSVNLADLAEQLQCACTAWDTLLGASEERPDVDVKFSDSYMLMYTSGTTGPSKAGIAPHSYPLTLAFQRIRSFGLVSDDVFYTCLPLFHGNALVLTCFTALAVGGTIALSRRFSVSRFWDEVRETGATQFNLVSVMTNFLWAEPPSPRDRDHKVRLAIAIPMPSFAAEFEQRFGIPIGSVYSLSDYGLATVLPPDSPKEKRGSAGRALPEVEVAILDDDDFELPAGQVGEIGLRAKQPWTTSQGYWKMPEVTATSRRNLWFHTGDRGYLDADGYLYFVDRKKDAIRRRGENISSWEIEKIIQRHPSVVDVAAYPVRGVSEDEVVVTVVCKDGQQLSPTELIEYCKQEMAYYMVPRYVEFASELPKGLTQKVEKYKLRENVEARLSQMWDREAAGIRVTRDS